MIRDDAPPPVELPDVWDGAELEDAVDEGPLAGFDEIYAERRLEPPAQGPATGPSGDVEDQRPDAEPPPPAPRRIKEDDTESVFYTLTAHLVILPATIAMVTAVLFFLYDVRAVFLPGAEALKWVGFCFSTATVLIARYARLSISPDTARLYTFALAAATVFTMWASPWDSPGVGTLGALSNALIIFLVWRYATTLTERLSADLDVRPPPPPRLYGLERLEMAAAKRNRPDDRVSIYDIGRRAAERRDTWRSDGEAATRQVVFLIVVALVGVAVAEPVLLAGAPELAGQALSSLTIFLFAAGVVIAAAASIRDQQRLWSLGGSAGDGGLTARLGLAALIVACLITSALAIPGLETPEGSGEIVQRRAERGTPAEVEQESPPPSEERVEDPNADEPPVEHRSQDQRQAGPSWLASLAALGQWLRWPVLAATALLLLFGLWRLGPGLWLGLRGALGNLLRGRRGSEKGRAGPRDPFAQLEVLPGLEPRAAVLASYGIWLDACAHLDHVRDPKQTPLEFLTAVPRALADLRPVGEKLTRLYVATAYARREIDEPAARAARQAVDELQLTVDAIKRRRAA
ncbi:MAG: DUF4129 domain-containing protein [Acidobacteriota bacterium]